ncbi:hypothetical protein [Sphingobacterium endophyticum]|uniref:hypothetical protein n=1 Tax=Sphingobacterium endophyticum TaxID=2546448 RepID=UPI0012E21337|nr:hypothetical protein [Sphingobacterium endophyticum]
MGLLELFSRRPSEFFGIEVHEFPNFEIFLYLSSKVQTVLTADFKSKLKATKTAYNQPFPAFPLIPLEFRKFHAFGGIMIFVE